MDKDFSFSCLLCGSNRCSIDQTYYDTRFGVADPYDIARCESCGLEQINPLPDFSKLKYLYEEHYNFRRENRGFYNFIRDALTRSFVFRLWLILDGDISFNLLKGSGRLLDFGCNEGRGLELSKKNGFTPEGLELNENAAAIARAKGFKVTTEILEKFSPDEPYDAIILSNVLEHSLDPLSMLGHLNRLLKKDGHLYVSCPNAKSWVRSIFGNLWINWHIPFHIVQFSEQTLTQMVEKKGFQVKSIKHMTPSNWVAQSLIVLLFFTPGKATTRLRSVPLLVMLMIIFRGLLFPFLWLGNLLRRGDCLVVSVVKVQ